MSIQFTGRLLLLHIDCWESKMMVVDFHNHSFIGKYIANVKFVNFSSNPARV